MEKINIKQVASHVFNQFFLIEFIRLVITLYLFMTDKNFYYGRIDVSNDFALKIYLVKVIPIILYAIVLISLLKLFKIMKLQALLIFIMVVIIYLTFDIRQLFFFIGNPRIRLYIALAISMIISFYYLYKSIHKRTDR